MIRFIQSNVRIVFLAILISFITTPTLADPQKALFLIKHLNSGDFQKDTHNIRECGKYTYGEVFDALYKRFEAEIINAQNNGLTNLSQKIFEEIVEAQRKIVRFDEAKFIRPLKNQAKDLNLHFADREDTKRWLDKIQTKINEAIKTGLNRKGELRSLLASTKLSLEKKSKYLNGRLYHREQETDEIRDRPEFPPELAKRFHHLIDILDMVKEQLGADFIQMKIKKEDPEFLQILQDSLSLDLDNEDKNFIRGVIQELITYQKEYQEYVDSLTGSTLNNVSLADDVSMIDVLKNIESHLKSVVIDQDDAIELIMDQELRIAFLGLGINQIPQIKYLMGEPGTGKDTVVKVKIDAIHGYLGAHLDHLFRTPVAANEADLWTILGAPTGYRGSESIPPLIEFLVLHSAGRYKIVPVNSEENQEKSKNGESLYKIIENKNWRPGMVFDGYFPPESGEIFINERHNWSKSNTDQLLKQLLENGYVTVKNPNGGEQQIYVPINISIASNEGAHLTTSKDEKGRRTGEPLSHEERMRRYEDLKDNKYVLREAIRKTNLSMSSRNPSAPGISDETLNRIDDSSLILMKPTSPEGFRRILKNKMELLQQLLLEVSGSWGPVDLSWDENLILFMQEFNYISENNARPTDDRIRNIVEATLFDAIRAGHLKPEPHYGNHVHLSIQKNKDGTANMKLNITPKSKGKKTKAIELFIRATASQRDKQPISDDRLNELLTLPQRLNKRVFGIEHITERLTELAIAMEESLRTNKDIAEAKDTAKIIAFFGMSSTGKSQTSKELARALKIPLLPLNFGQVQSKSDIKRMFFGEKIGDDFIPSIFMQHYDRNPDGMVVSLEELVNADNAEQVLNMLFDLFREAVVTDFSDGVPRPMGKIIFVVNANIGIEDYKNISRNLPEYVRLEAYREVHETMMSSPSYRRSVLERYLSPPLINRIDERNIYFFGPLGYGHVRALSYLQMQEALESLRPHPSRRGWNIYFPSEEAFDDIIDILEKEGFNVESQGASIVSMFNKVFVPHFRMTMYQHRVETGSDILLSLDKQNTKIVEMGEEKVTEIAFNVHVKGQYEPIRFTLRGKEIEFEMETPDINRKLTGIHEAGHAIVEQYFFGDYQEHKGVSIIRGATKIGGEIIPYEGVAKSKKVKKLNITREYIVREMATLYGGFEAQKLLTKGARHDGGKSNDIKRATQLAKIAILIYGLEEEWGLESLSDPENIDNFIATLTHEKENFLRN